MRGLRAILMHNRAMAGLVIAAALLLRAMIPAGYMIAPATEAKQVFVTVCTGMQGESVKVALQTGGKQSQPGKEHQAKDSPCAFTALAGLADLPQLAQLALPVVPAQEIAASSHAVSVGRGLAAPPPYQTGPPLIA